MIFLFSRRPTASPLWSFLLLTNDYADGRSNLPPSRGGKWKTLYISVTWLGFSERACVSPPPIEFSETTLCVFRTVPRPCNNDLTSSSFISCHKSFINEIVRPLVDSGSGCRFSKMASSTVVPRHSSKAVCARARNAAAAATAAHHHYHFIEEITRANPHSIN